MDPNRINDPKLMDAVGPNSHGDAVIRAEILLDRAKFSPGEIADSYTENARKAVAAFQKERGLPISGTVDDRTWQALNSEQGGAGSEPQPNIPQAAATNQPPQNMKPPNGNAESTAPKNNQERPAASPDFGPNAFDQASREVAQAQPGQSTPDQTQAAPSNDSYGPQAQSPPSGPPALIFYTISQEDVDGPFTKIPRARNGEQLMLEEAKLDRLNYSSPLEALAAKFHVNPKLLTQLNSGKSFEKAGEEILAPNVRTPFAVKAASVVVDGDERSVTAIDAQGKVLAYYPATVGSEHDPLPVGTWKILGKSVYPHYHYNPNLFWDAENKNARAILPPGPKSPVGVVWISLSKMHYGIHGTPEPSLIGRTQSHGCIRLTNWDAEELANMVQPGTPAILKASE